MPETGAPIILAEDLSKRFARQRGIGELIKRPFAKPEVVTALAGASLEVRAGEVFGLLGPNGAGKTTLIKILSCLVLPDSGRAEVNGCDVSRDEMGVKRSIGYVASDERSFYWRLTGAQNLRFFARLQQVDPQRIEARIIELMSDMELGDKGNKLFSTYSSGMRQRLAIARALLHEPDVLYLDEPTRSLDPVTARHIRDYVRNELVSAGKTILLATHNLHEAAALCDRMAIMAGSRVHRTGRLEDFRSLLTAGRRYRLVTDRQVPLEGIATVVPETEAETGSIPQAGDNGNRCSVLLELERSGDDHLNPLMGRLSESGARVYELTREETSLEDLFHQLFETAASTGPEKPA